jgi:arylsulfatase A-like enzyme
VVFIITDDQDVELGSLNAMPIVKKELIEQGTMLRNFFVDVPVCCPSRTSFLSGRYAHNNGAFSQPQGPGGMPTEDSGGGNWCGNGIFWKGPKQNFTVATYMKAAGYITGIFGKELNTVDANFVSPGWDRYFVLMDECKYFGNSWADDGRKTTLNSSVYMTTAIQDAAFQWIDANRRTSERPWPFFAYIAPHAPHQPAQPDVMHETAFADLKAPRTPAWNMSAPDHHWYSYTMYCTLSTVHCTLHTIACLKHLGRPPLV